MKKRLLLLGGADIQVDAIKSAQKLNYYVITCDYLPSNPGHKIADEYHNVSTTDLDGVLALAKKLNIDAISSYASDPGALTAAYVSDKLGIPGNSFESVKNVSDKVIFRSIQRELKINYPFFDEVYSEDELRAFLDNHKGKNFIIKPVDSSGSKGVFIINNESEDLGKKFKSAFDFSRAKKVIVEENLIRDGKLLTGDVVIQDHKIIFSCYGDVHFNNSLNGLVPRSVSLPSSKSDAFLEQANIDLEKIFKHQNITTGVFNVDVLEVAGKGPYIIDIGARNGGNLLNNIFSMRSGIDLISISMKQHFNDPITPEELVTNPSGFFAHYVLHSTKDGLFQKIAFSAELESKIIYKSIRPRQGDEVKTFINSSFRIGLLLLSFDTFEEMHSLLNNMYKHVNLILK